MVEKLNIIFFPKVLYFVVLNFAFSPAFIVETRVFCHAVFFIFFSSFSVCMCVYVYTLVIM